MKGTADARPRGRGDLSRVATAIRKRERRYRALVENATDVFVICGADGTVRYVSPSLYRLVGRDPSEELGRANHDIQHPDDLSRVILAFERALADGRADVEFRVRHRDGTWRWVALVVTNMLDDPDIEGFVLNGHDITERKHAEELVRVREEWWRALLGNSKDAITVLDADGRVTYVSPSIERVVGYDETTMFTMPVFEIVHPDDLERAADILLVLNEGVQIAEPIEMRVRHASGEYRWIEAIANNQLDNPVVKGIVVNVRDVTERKQAEEELARQGLHDSLTGLANRSLFLDRLTSALARARQSAAVTAVLFLDLDHFRLINDSMGHACGDALLTEVANRLQGLLGEGDTAARIGGDEFALILPDTDEAAARVVAEKLIDAVRARGSVSNGARRATVTASIGITPVTGGLELDVAKLLIESDIAMFHAKESGKNRIAFYVGSGVVASS